MKVTNEPVALVTGAARGIGAAIARQLAVAGNAVIVNFIEHEAEALALVEKIESAGGRAQVCQADVSQAKQVKQLFAKIRADYGRLDTLVNNAGIVIDQPIARMSDHDWQKVLDTNLTGSFYCTRDAVKLLHKSDNASIITLGSSGVFRGNPGQANYAAAKGGAMAMVRCLSRELGDWGIRVNGVVPGFVKTDLTAELSKEYWQTIISQTPSGRLSTANDIAAAVVFLASRQAQNINGQVVVIDGGRV